MLAGYVIMNQMETKRHSKAGRREHAMTQAIKNLEITDERPEVQFIWVAADVHGARLGAWISPEGEIILNDHEVWNIDQDLRCAGIDPDSEEASELLEAWTGFLHERLGEI